jgi:IrrE N-terminal-like domain
VPIALPTDGPCGAWLSVDDAEYILYEERTSRLHQEHIILHEIGHLVCHHEATPVLDETAMVLMPNLDPGMIRRVLGRTSYSAREEQQAEMIASLVLQQVSAWSSEPSWSVAPEVAGIVDRLELSLEHPPRWRGHG